MRQRQEHWSRKARTSPASATRVAIWRNPHIYDRQHLEWQAVVIKGHSEPSNIAGASSSCSCCSGSSARKRLARGGSGDGGTGGPRLGEDSPSTWCSTYALYKTPHTGIRCAFKTESNAKTFQECNLGCLHKPDIVYFLF